MRKRFTAFVVFTGAEHRRPWRIFTRRGWRHCRLMLPVYYPHPSLTARQYTQVLDYWTDHCRADVVFRAPAELAQDALRDGATCVIAFPVDQQFTGKYQWRGVMTCVSMAKAFLSINAWYVLTPEHLARWLLRNGGYLLERNERDSTLFRSEAGQESAAGSSRGAAAAGSGPEQADGR